MPSRSQTAADAELFHAGLGFTGMISAGDRQGFGGSATSVRSPAGPLKSLIGYELLDQDPMASPPCMMVVTILVLVMRGCCDGIWRAAVDTL